MSLYLLIGSIVSIILFAIGTQILGFNTWAMVYGALIGFFMIILNGELRR